MKVLLVHNEYQQLGGEDQVFDDDGRLLEEHGHVVSRYTVHNDTIRGMTRLQLARTTVWSTHAYRALRDLVRRERPDVAHFHNTLPLVSPAGYYAVRGEGVPVVQTLHNYRLLCPNALLFRDGHPCEECVGKAVPWPAVQHACYRQSTAATAAVATMLTLHRAAGTWRRRVDLYATPSEFTRRKFIEGGLRAEHVVVKHNVLHPDPGVGPGDGGYVAFVGRLVKEKGVLTMLAAWERWALGDALPLVIVGDGPLAPDVARAAERIPGVSWMGRRPSAEVQAVLARARCLLLPSEWYETFGRVVAEAFAAGTPAVVSSGGAHSELVEHGRTGLVFRPGDADDLARRLREELQHAQGFGRMRAAARAEYVAKFGGAANVRTLLDIYTRAIARHAADTPRRWRTSTFAGVQTGGEG
ncbi:MAG TPA: glycosyltransferase [Gemmatimonadaceae bacterium]|nr:glycosyltransferase [Gemmatimonadaceae bacterium]